MITSVISRSTVFPAAHLKATASSSPLAASSYVVAVSRQHLDQQLAQRGLVLHHQQRSPLRALGFGWPAILLFFRLLPSSKADRQRKMVPAPGVLSTVNVPPLC